MGKESKKLHPDEQNSNINVNVTVTVNVTVNVIVNVDFFKTWAKKDGKDGKDKKTSKISNTAVETANGIILKCYNCGSVGINY